MVSQSPSFSTNSSVFQSTLATLFSALCLAGPLFAADWRGTVDEQFQTPENWQSGGGSSVPTSGVLNRDTLCIQNGPKAPLSYTAAEGDTQFSGQLLIGQNKGSAGELKISGGSLSVNTDGRWIAILGQTVEGTIQISGGLFSLVAGIDNTASEGLPKQVGLVIGNESSGIGNFDVRGGEVDVGGAILLGRAGGTGTLAIGGTGKVSCDGPVVFFPGPKSSVIELAQGEGLLQVTSDGNLLFPAADSDNDGFIDFAKGSKSRISLKGKDKAYFDKLVAERRIRIGGGFAKPEQFQFRRVNGQGELSLANTVH
jgi:hypothetical protein